MNSLFQIEIPKRNSYCSLQGERLLPGMEIYSQLLEQETEGFARRDFCSTCWGQIQAKEENNKLQGYWKSKIEQRKPTVESSRMSRALSLLKEWQCACEPREAEIFVLCLFLAHARQLVLRQEFKKEEVIYHLYEVLRQEEYVTVKVVPLSQLQIETIQKSLANSLCNEK